MKMSIFVLSVVLLSSCAGAANLKDMSAREMNAYLNAPMYPAGSVERAWEDAFYDERLSYSTRNKISEVLDDYQLGKISTREALRRIARIKTCT
jgi:hypothetical protein